MGVVIVVAANKGGTGKSTLAAHLAELAHELDCRVAVVDTDPQADLCSLLGREDGEWREAQAVPARLRGMTLVFSPGEVPDLEKLRARCDVVIVDTPPKFDPDLSQADCVVIPIDGPSAVRDCAETVYACVRADVPLKLVVPNKLDAGGNKLAKALAAGIRKNQHVKAAPEVPLSPCVARTADTRAPAWSDLYPNAKGARAMRSTCEWILREAGVAP